MNPPIIEVLWISDNQIDYRLRPTNLDTATYGIVLATLARQIGEMFFHEGGFNAEDITRQIVGHMLKELKQPTGHTARAMMQ